MRIKILIPTYFFCNVFLNASAECHLYIFEYCGHTTRCSATPPPPPTPLSLSYIGYIGPNVYILISDTFSRITQLALTVGSFYFCFHEGWLVVTAMLWPMCSKLIIVLLQTNQCQLLGRSVTLASTWVVRCPVSQCLCNSPLSLSC